MQFNGLRYIVLPLGGFEKNMFFNIAVSNSHKAIKHISFALRPIFLTIVLIFVLLGYKIY